MASEFNCPALLLRAPNDLLKDFATVLFTRSFGAGGRSGYFTNKVLETMVSKTEMGLL